MRGIVAAALVMAGCVASSHGGEKLFEDRKTDWRICIPEKPSPEERTAARELSHYLGKISGASFEVCASGESPSKNTIIIGSLSGSPLVKSMAGRLKLSDAAGENVAVCALDGNLWLAGNTPRAALFAVYTFLSDVMGVRWLWPGESGEFVPRKTEFALGSLSINHVPGFKYRGFHQCGVHEDPETETWMSRNRMNILRSGNNERNEVLDARREKGFHIMFSNHNIILDKSLMASHPEYFAEIGGKRHAAQLCWSNPDVDRLMADKVAAMYDKYPRIDIMSLFPADNMNYCMCEKCAKVDGSTRWFNFLGRIAEGVRKKHPDAKFASIAYQCYKDPPAGSLKNLEFVEYCMYDRCYAHRIDSCDMNKKAMGKVDEWMKKEVPVGVYGYEFDVFSPNVAAPLEKMIEDQIRVFSKAGLVLLIPEVQPMCFPKNARPEDRFWNLFRLPLYVYARMMWDPGLKLADITKEFCGSAYGRASGPMAEYFTLLQDAWDRQGGHYTYFGNAPLSASDKFLNRQLIADLQGRVKSASEAASAIADEKERARVLGQIGMEEKIFAKWRGLYDEYQAAKSEYVVNAPFAERPDDIDSFVSLPKFKGQKDGAGVPVTEARAAWNDKSILIDVVCFEKDVSKLKCSRTRHDDDVWADECVEIFVSNPRDNMGMYKHFVVSPKGVRLDSVALGGMTFNKQWNPEWTASAKIESDRWTVRVEIPFAALGGAPNVGDTWGFSIKRSNGERPDVANSGFPDASYHDMNAFGFLHFVKSKGKKVVLFIPPAHKEKSGDALSNLSSRLSAAGWQPRIVHDETGLDNIKFDASVICVRYPLGKIPLEFFRDRLVPEVRAGKLLVFSAYGGLPLEKFVGDPSFELNWSGWGIDPERKTVFAAPGDWSSKPRDLLAKIKASLAPSSGYQPVAPDGWEPMASLKMKSGEVFHYLLAKKLGEGRIVVTSGDFGLGGGCAVFGSGDVDSVVFLLDNLYEAHFSDGGKSS